MRQGSQCADSAFPIQWFAGLHNGRVIDGEEPDMTAESMDLILMVGLDLLSGDELAHWSQSSDAGHEDEIRALPVLDMLGLYPEDIDELVARRETVEKTTKAFV